MTLPDRKLQTPPGRSGFKIAALGKSLPLIYLGWGARRFDKNPIAVARNFGYVYILVLNGTPQIMTDKAQFNVSAGNMILFDIDCPMGWADQAQAQSKILVWIWRDPPTIEHLRADVQNFSRWKLDAQKLSIFEKIHNESRQELSRLDDYSPYALSNLQAKLDVELLRANSNSVTKSVEHTRYAAALDWMRHNLTAQHPVVELSIYLGVSESTLQRIFKRNTKQGPLAVFQSLKAERAAQLVSEGLPIKMIAYQLGYRHPSDFTRFYTKTFGQSPSGRSRFKTYQS